MMHLMEKTSADCYRDRQSLFINSYFVIARLDQAIENLFPKARDKNHFG